MTHTTEVTSIAPSQSDEVRQGLAHVELTEYLFSTTAAAYAAEHASHEIRDHIREAMRLARFTVFNWLITNGVQIPAALLNDKLHAPVGQQLPDQQVHPRLGLVQEGS